jgi:hypothetical protein
MLLSVALLQANTCAVDMSVLYRDGVLCLNPLCISHPAVFMLLVYPTQDLVVCWIAVTEWLGIMLTPEGFTTVEDYCVNLARHSPNKRVLWLAYDANPHSTGEQMVVGTKERNVTANTLAHCMSSKVALPFGRHQKEVNHEHS